MPFDANRTLDSPCSSRRARLAFSDTFLVVRIVVPIRVKGCRLVGNGTQILMHGHLRPWEEISAISSVVHKRLASPMCLPYRTRRHPIPTIYLDNDGHT